MLDVAGGDELVGAFQMPLVDDLRTQLEPMTTTSTEERDLRLRRRVAVAGCSTKPRSLSRVPFYPLCIPCKSGQKKESRRADSRTADLRPPVTSLLEHVLARPHASGNCACLGGFGSSGAVILSSVYQCVSARLQYGCSTVAVHSWSSTRARDEVPGVGHSRARGAPAGRPLRPPSPFADLLEGRFRSPNHRCPRRALLATRR